MESDSKRRDWRSLAVFAFNLAAIAVGCIWSHSIAIVRMVALDDNVTLDWTAHDWHLRMTWLVTDALLRCLMAGAILWLFNRGAVRRRMLSSRLATTFIVVGCIGVIVSSYPILRAFTKKAAVGEHGSQLPRSGRPT